MLEGSGARQSLRCQLSHHAAAFKKNVRTSGRGRETGGRGPGDANEYVNMLPEAAPAQSCFEYSGGVHAPP